MATAVWIVVQCDAQADAGTAPVVCGSRTTDLSVARAAIVLVSLTVRKGDPTALPGLLYLHADPKT